MSSLDDLQTTSFKIYSYGYGSSLNLNITRTSGLIDFADNILENKENTAFIGTRKTMERIMQLNHDSNRKIVHHLLPDTIIPK